MADADLEAFYAELATVESSLPAEEPVRNLQRGKPNVK